MAKDKRSFFERLTGAVKIEHDDMDFDEVPVGKRDHPTPNRLAETQGEWIEETAEEGQLTVDVYQTTNDIVIKTIVAGVRPDELDISISRDMVTIKGKREESRETSEDNFFHKELYWGSFSRTILLPEEIDVESAEATEKHGLLTIKLPKIDKRRQSKLRVKSGS